MLTARGKSFFLISLQNAITQTFFKSCKIFKLEIIFWGDYRPSRCTHLLPPHNWILLQHRRPGHVPPQEEAGGGGGGGEEATATIILIV